MEWVAARSALSWDGILWEGDAPDTRADAGPEATLGAFIMLPEGVAPFKGKVNEEIVVTLDKEGVYGIKCQPHYGMGMVALIEVGAPVNLDAAKAVKQTGKAKTAFAELFGQVVAAN